MYSLYSLLTIYLLLPFDVTHLPTAVSSIPVSRLMAATESNTVSYSSLIRFTKLSLKFQSLAPAKHFNVQLHYRDEDGDDVLFTSDVELMEALCWAASSAQGTDAPTLLVHAAVVPLSRRPSSESSTTSVSIGSTRSLIVQQHRCAESDSSTRSLPVQLCTKPSRVAPGPASDEASTSTAPQSSLDIEMPSLVASKKEEGSSKRRSNLLGEFLRKLLAPLPPLIKGEVRPEASSNASVGEVLVGGLANVLGSAALFIETQENNTQGKLASLNSKRATKAGVEHLAPLHRMDCTSMGYKRIVVTPPSLDTDYMPDFTHKRHSCDGCGMDPIVGFRYHATPNIDLCERCFDTALVLSNSGDDMAEVAEEEKDRKPPSEIEIKADADGEESDGIGIVNDDVTITFDLVQHNSDQGVIHSKFANVLLRMRRGLKILTKSQKEQLVVETRSEYPRTALEDSSRVSDFDVACAIQKSLQDLRKRQQIECTTTNGEDDTTDVTEDSAGDKTTTNNDENAHEKSQNSDEEWCILANN